MNCPSNCSKPEFYEEGKRKCYWCGKEGYERISLENLSYTLNDFYMRKKAGYSYRLGKYFMDVCYPDLSNSEVCYAHDDRLALDFILRDYVS